MSDGDMVAIEAKYHIKCLNNLYNKLGKQKNESENASNEDSINYGMALVKLIDIINNTIQNATEVPVFKLSVLKVTFNHILISHGTHDSNIHSTRLKDHLLQHIPGLESLKKGKEILLTVKDDFGEALFKECLREPKDDGMCVAQAANILRKSLFKGKHEFNGHFDTASQKESVPNILYNLICMLLEGQTSHDIKRGAFVAPIYDTINHIRHN